MRIRLRVPNYFLSDAYCLPDTIAARDSHRKRERDGDHVLVPNDIRPNRRFVTSAKVVKRRKVAVSFTKRPLPRARGAKRMISESGRSDPHDISTAL